MIVRAQEIRSILNVGQPTKEALLCALCGRSEVVVYSKDREASKDESHAVCGREPTKHDTSDTYEDC